MHLLFCNKILPRPPKLRRRPLPSVNESHDEPSDYVFRIYSKTNHEDFSKYIFL